MAARRDTSLRIAQLVESMSVGGAERLAVQIAAVRAEAGDDSLLYVLGEPGPLSATIPDTVTVRYLGLARASVRNPFAFIASLHEGRRRLSAVVREDGVEVLQTHLPGANFWGLLLQILGVVKVIPTIHNNREFDYGDADNPLRARFRRSAYRQMICSCPAVVAVSPLVRDAMIEQLGLRRSEAESMVVVPNGVSLPAPLAASERAEVRAGFGAADVPLLLAAGRHTEQKNFSCLIDAAARLRDRGVSFRLVIAGEGELHEAHAAHISRLELDDHVALPGNLADLGRVMQAADVFVLSSRWEGLPLVLLEAMAAGCAVAGTRIDGIAEVLRDGETGRVVASDDADELADAIALLIEDPEQRRRLAAGARALVERDYSFARVGRDLGALYERVTRGH